jgi:hypothetical protein
VGSSWRVTLVIKRIAVTYRLAVDQNADHATIERVHGLHAECCRSPAASIAVSTPLRRWSTSLRSELDGLEEA